MPKGSNEAPPAKRGFSCGLFGYVVVLIIGLGIGMALKGKTTSIDEASLLGDWSQPPPWPLFIGANALSKMFKTVSDALLPPPIRVLDISQAYQQTMLAYTSSKLEIAGFLASEGRPKTAKEIAAFLKLEGRPQAEARVERLMLALAAFDLATLVPPAASPARAQASADADGQKPRFANSALSAVLRKDHPNSMSGMLAHQVEDAYPVFHKLAETFTPEVDEGTAAWDLVWGKEGFPLEKGGMWHLFEMKPEREEQFGRAMSALNGMGAQAMVEDGPFSKYSRFVDIGGSRGHFLHQLMVKYPAARGTLFDRAPVIANAKKAWEEGVFQLPASHPLPTFETGSFFDLVPQAKDNDAFIMRYILHDWPSAEVRQILKNAHKSLSGKPNSALIIGECAMPNHDQVGSPPALYNIDMVMMMLFRAQERSPFEWEQLFNETGFELIKIYPTRSIVHWVEARAV